jgi:hypothetical protein
LKSETLDLDERFGKEYAGHYVFSEITWAKRGRIIQKYTKYSKVSGQLESTDHVSIQAEIVWVSLKQQPESKPISLQKLLGEGEEDGVPIELGELLSKTTNKLNSLQHADVRFLLEQLDEETRTRILLSFGFVKSSGGPSQPLDVSQPKPSSNS